MVVYLEAHPIVLDAIFAVGTMSVLALCTAKIIQAIDQMRQDVIKNIRSRNELLREGFATLAGMLASRPCLKHVQEDKSDVPTNEELE